MPTLLRSHAGFRMLWIGQLVSQAGTKVYLIALAWHFVHVLRDPHGLVGMLLAGSLPALLLGPLVGPILDRLDRKRILIVADLASAAITFGIALAIHGGLPRGWIFLGVGMLSVTQVFFGPAARAMLPSLVGQGFLQEAASLLSLVVNLANLAGAATGGALVGLMGTVNAVVVNGLSFALSALATTFVPRPNPSSGEGRASWGEDLREGFRYLRGHVLALRMMLLGAALNLFFVAIVVYLPILISHNLGMGAQAFGIAEACAPVGSLVAAVLLSRQRTEAHAAWFRNSILGLGAAFLLVALGRSYAATLVAMALIGALLSTVNIHALAFFTKQLDSAYLGRFFSLMEAISFGTFPLAYLLAGVLVARVDLYLLFLGHGAALLALGLLGLVLLRPSPTPE